MTKKAIKNKTLADLDANDCRWPIGDPRHPDFHFCGAQKLLGRPYCAQHWQMSFEPRKPREKAAPPVQLVLKAA